MLGTILEKENELSLLVGPSRKLVPSFLKERKLHSHDKSSYTAGGFVVGWMLDDEKLRYQDVNKARAARASKRDEGSGFPKRPSSERKWKVGHQNKAGKYRSNNIPIHVATYAIWGLDMARYYVVEVIILSYTYRYTVHLWPSMQSCYVD